MKLLVSRYVSYKLTLKKKGSGGCNGCAKAQAAVTGTLKAQPRGATPRLRSGAEAGRTPCPKGSGQEELPDVRGQGKWPRVPDCDSTGTAERSYPTSEAGGGGREKIPSVRGQGRWLGGPTPRSESCGCAGAGGPRGAIPC